jgi:hypothetical protein
MAYFDFDTTVFSDGVHAIYWTADDDAGNTGGIGSRYFTIRNQETGMRRQEELQIPGIPIDYFRPVIVKKGWKQDTLPRLIYPDDDAIITVEVQPLERVVIHLSGDTTFNTHLTTLSAHIMVGGGLRPLPIGSTLDREKGIFYWQPGPGFIGEYLLAFVIEGEEGERSLKYIIIKIIPRIRE